MMKNILTLLLLLPFFCVAQYRPLVFTGTQQTGPRIILSTGVLSLGNTTETVASTPVTCTVSGVNLTEDILLSSNNEDVQLSLSSGSGFGPSVTVNETAGSTGTVTIYVRIASTAAAGSVIATITASSAGATSKTISASGTVGSPPTLEISTNTLPEMTAQEGTNSSVQSFTVSGYNLTANGTVGITGGNYEISTNSGSGYTNSISLGRTGASLTGQPVTIYARTTTSSTVGSHTGIITVSSTGATTQNVGVSSTISSATAYYKRVLIDFGTTANATGTDANGRRWNDVPGIEVPRVWLINPVDTAGNVVSGLTIAVNKKPGGDFLTNDSSLNSANNLGVAVGDYPITAVRDAMYIDPSVSGSPHVVTWTYTLPTGKKAKVTYWGTRNNTNSNWLQFRTGADGAYGPEYNSAQNSTYTNAAVLNITNTNNTIICQVKPGSSFGHISLIDIILEDE